jgi:hypothetical protein
MSAAARTSPAKSRCGAERVPAIGIDVAANDIQEVDEARRLEAPRDFDAVCAGKPDFPVLVGDHAHAEQEAGADRRAHRLHHAQRKRHAGIEVAAERIVPLVRRGRPELVGQMAVGVDLQPVQTGRLHALRRRRVVGDDAVDVPVLDRLRKRPMGRLADRGGRQHRQPVRLVPGGAPAEMGDLDHHRRTMRVALVGQAAQPGHDLVLVDEQVAEHRRAVRRHHGRARRHGQRRAALRLFDVIQAIAVLRHAVLAVERLVRRAHDPVAQGQVLQPEGTQQRVGGLHAGAFLRWRDWTPPVRLF